MNERVTWLCALSIGELDPLPVLPFSRTECEVERLPVHCYGCSVQKSVEFNILHKWHQTELTNNQCLFQPDLLYNIRFFNFSSKTLKTHSQEILKREQSNLSVLPAPTSLVQRTVWFSVMGTTLLSHFTFVTLSKKKWGNLSELRSN